METDKTQTCKTNATYKKTHFTLAMLKNRLQFSTRTFVVINQSYLTKNDSKENKTLESLAYQLAAEHEKAAARTYAGTIPPR